MASNLLTHYSYELPQELIATKPASPRDSARLMVVDSKSGHVSFDVFRNVDQYLPKQALLVLNQTKVLPARVQLHKDTGGKVVVLFLINEWKKGDRYIKGMVDRGIAINVPLYLTKRKWLIPVSQNANIFTFEANFPLANFLRDVQRRGKTPIPPYLKETPLSESKLRQRYQTIFAKHAGSVAAPTASLHFTERVFEKLVAKGIQKSFVTLHVGMGTFAPISERNFESRTLHEETFDVPHKTIEEVARAKREGKPVIAVGTTAMRTLESAAVAFLYERTEKLRNVSGRTDLFMYPPYDFKIADALITNFHVPQSSLMCLVDAFLEYKKSPKRIMELYELAIKERMRFFSFGDAMLIL